jgi:hypothetical protein
LGDAHIQGSDSKRALACSRQLNCALQTQDDFSVIPAKTAALPLLKDGAAAIPNS